MPTPGRPRFVLLFLAYAAKLSGGDRHLLEMAARWRAEVDIAVVAPPHALETVGDFLGDVEVSVLGSPRGIGPGLALEYVRRAVVARRRSFPPADVALASSHFSPDAAALARLVQGGALGVAYVYHLVAGRSGFAPRTLWSRADERVGLTFLRRHADLVFVSNDATRAALAQRGFDPVRTDVGIDLEPYRRREHPQRPGQGLFLGRMVSSKGALDAVEVWADVHARLPQAKLVVVGEGPARERAIALAGELGIASAVEMRGFVSEDEKRRLLQESTVLLAPSYEEGWGIAVCEALASGLPVVAYRLSTLDELFPAAYLGAPLGDRAALADLAVRVLADSSEAAALSRKGEEAAARYDIDRVAADELETILRRSSSRPPAREAATRA